MRLCGPSSVVVNPDMTICLPRGKKRIFVWNRDHPPRRLLGIFEELTVPWSLCLLVCVFFISTHTDASFYRNHMSR